MNTSALSLSSARAAELLLNSILRVSEQSFEGSTGNGTTFPGFRDTVSFSPAATAVLTNPTSNFSSATADNATTGNASSPLSPQNDYTEALSNAVFASEADGDTTSFSFAYSAASDGKPVITGALAGALDGVSTSGAVTPQPGESTAELNFAKIYAAQEADGVKGRFYNGTDVSSFTSNMSSSEKAAFLTAYHNKTLDIQNLNDAPGVTVTGGGNETMTFSEGALGGSEVFGGSGGYADVTALEKTNQYVMIQSAGFFGPVVISWGGPATASSQ